MEDILLCIIIVITPSGDVVPPIMDVIDVFDHVKYRGKTSFVSRVNSTYGSQVNGTNYLWLYCVFKLFAKFYVIHILHMNNQGRMIKKEKSSFLSKCYI